MNQPENNFWSLDNQVKPLVGVVVVVVVGVVVVVVVAVVVVLVVVVVSFVSHACS